MADYSKPRNFSIIKKNKNTWISEELDLFLNLGHLTNITVLSYELGNFDDLLTILHMGGAGIKLGGGFKEEEKMGEEARRKRMWVFVALKFS